MLVLKFFAQTGNLLRDRSKQPLDKDATMDQYYRFPFSNLDIHCCAVFSGGMTTLLLTPGTGVCRPTDSKPAARYRQTAAAVDEAAQTNPTVPPFDPAVRVIAIALLCFRCCVHRSTIIPLIPLILSFDGQERMDTTSFRSPPCPQAVFAF